MGSTATTIAVYLALLGYHPAADLSEESVDLIEINHFHDDQGRPVFDQILFYDWSAAEARYQLRDWRLLKSPNQIPLANSRDREFISVWNDFKARDTLRATKAKMVRETWTQYDPELVEREFLPENRRRKLREVHGTRKPAPKSADGASCPPAAGTLPMSPARGETLRPLQCPMREEVRERP